MNKLPNGLVEIPRFGDYLRQWQKVRHNADSYAETLAGIHEDARKCQQEMDATMLELREIERKIMELWPTGEYYVRLKDQLFVVRCTPGTENAEVRPVTETEAD